MEKDLIVIATKQGQVSKFDASKIRETSRNSVGVKGMKLADGDEVVGMAVVQE
jgi:DNA gyrase subunit A